MVKHQIIEYNRLLEQQVRLMSQLHSSGVASIPSTNGSHISPSKSSIRLDVNFIMAKILACFLSVQVNLYSVWVLIYEIMSLWLVHSKWYAS